jgi:serine O-acetyltransferase
METSFFDSEKIIAELAEITVEQTSAAANNRHSFPNITKIKEIIVLIKSLLFPEIYGESDNCHENAVINITRLYILLEKQVFRALSLSENVENQQTKAQESAIAFLHCLPEIKKSLLTDIQAVCDCDPAATGTREVILCYPAIQAMLHYRTAHELLLLDIPLLPRMFTELAHSDTGIDIHPAAQIGEYFAIDHGTGVVIGETCIIGKHVRLYQGVTLGAKGFVFDENGLPLNIPRHPIIEDNVVIYSNSTILGRITIGHDSVIGGNVWQTHNVPPHSHIIQKRATNAAFTDGGGI